MKQQNFLRLVAIKYTYLLIAATLFAVAGPAPCGPADRVDDNRAAHDGWILHQVRESGLSEALAIVQALGRREDPDVQTVLDGLDAYAGGEGAGVDRSPRAELLLRVLLEAIGREPRRVAANAASLSRMASDLSRYREPLLRARLLSLLPVLPGLPAASLLMREGGRLAERLAAGSASLEMEARFFLEAALRVGGAELGEACLRIAERTLDPGLAGEARRAARSLLTGGAEADPAGL